MATVALIAFFQSAARIRVRAAGRKSTGSPCFCAGSTGSRWLRSAVRTAVRTGVRMRLTVSLFVRIRQFELLTAHLETKLEALDLHNGLFDSAVTWTVDDPDIA